MSAQGLTSPTLPFGMLGRPHGVRGELVLRPFNDGPATLSHARFPLVVELVRGAQRREATLTTMRPFAQDFLVRVAGFESREQVAALTNHEVWVPRPSLPPLPDGEVYVQDLLGCAVFDPEGRLLGLVRSAFWNGAHDVLTIQSDGGPEVLIPAVPEFLRVVDVAARRLVVDPHE